MRVGDHIQYKVKIVEKKDDRLILHCKETVVQAEVVYIHPDRRFYVIEYQIGGRRLRESFLLRRYRA